jgi:MmyB-like transcription regulator ligand binding domain
LRSGDMTSPWPKPYCASHAAGTAKAGRGATRAVAPSATSAATRMAPAGNGAFDALVALLSARSAEYRARWSAHEVRAQTTEIKLLHHPRWRNLLPNTLPCNRTTPRA